MGNKKVDDAVANFFGDEDMDWLDADSEEVSRKSIVPEEPVPAALGGAITIMPPVEEESDEDAPTTRVTAGEFDELQPMPLSAEPLVSISDVDPPTLEVDPTSEEVESASMDFPALDAAPIEPPEEEPEETEVAPKPERPVAPPVEKWEPSSDADAWREAAVALVSEAASDEARRGALLFEAARIYRRRLGDDVGARALSDDALAAGFDEPGVYAMRMQIGQATADAAFALESARELAKRLEGAAAAEAWRTVAALAGEDNDDAVAALNEAIEADPSDFTALADLVSLLRGDEEQVENLIYALGLMGELAQGPAAAALHHERAELLAAKGRDVDAQAAWVAARAALPSHLPSLVGLSGLLQRVGLHNELADLYEAEARREAQPEPAYWLWMAARSRREAGQDDAADALYREAATLGSGQAAREHVAWLASAGRHDALVEALRAQVEASTERGRAFAVYRLARALEEAGDHDGALDAYREAATLDPESRPAASAVERVLRAKGDSAGLRAFWRKQLEGDVAPKTRVSLLHRIGEEAESAGEQQEAREAMESLLEVDAGFIPAIEALQRIYNRTDAWAELAALHDRRAALSTEKPQRALFLHRAGSVLEHRLQDLDEAQARYEEALKLVPDQASSLDALLALLERKEDWKALSMRLFKAGQAATHEASKVSLLYRASRVLVDRVDNPKKAEALLKQVLQLSPDFGPARALMADLVGGRTSKDLAGEAATASGRAQQWLLLAAADAARGEAKGRPGEHLAKLLEHEPAHAAGMAELERHAAATGDVEALTKAYQRALDLAESEAESVRLGTALADLFARQGKTAEVQTVLERLAAEAASQPMAVLASGHGAHKTASALLAGLEEPAEVLARATQQAEIDPKGAVRELEGLYETPVAGAAAERALVIGATGAARLKALQVLSVEEGPIAGTARLRLLEESPSAQVPELEAALAARPSAEGVFRKLRGIRVADRDVEGLRALYNAYRPEELSGLAEALEAAGDPAAAADLYADRNDLASLVTVERLRAAAEQWDQVLTAIEAQEQVAADETVRAALAARKRWVLAEHLAETDAAWEAYKSLHESNPDDREVTRALARIAGRRGETTLGIQYLRELASSAANAEEAAAYQREIAGVHEVAGNVGEARQAYLDALDHVRDDTEALSGLRRLSEKEEDWASLIQVLQREAGVAGAQRRVEVLREIATVTEERLGDDTLAVERWRDVLEEDAEDTQGLERTLALAEKVGDWALFVDVGARLAEQLSGREKAVLLRRVGIACEEQLGRKDAERYFTQALEAAPDGVAAKRLEKLRRKFGDWSGAVQMLVTQAEAATDHADKVRHLEEAARIEAEQRHDSAAASALYARLLEWEPDHRAALLYQSEHLFTDGNFNEALPVYDRLESTLDEDDVDFDDFDVRLEVSGFFYRYAELLRAAGRSDEALSRYQKALELNPAHLPSLEAVGPLYMQRREHKLGQSVWRQLLQLTGGHGDKEKIAYYYTQLGVVEHALGNTEKASKRFSKALELNPAHVGALKGMAVLLEEKEDWNNLLNFYNNIIYHATSSQDVVDAYLTKGRVLDERLQRPDKAAQHYDRLLAFDANQPRALLRLAEIRAREGDWDRAAANTARGLRVAKGPTPLRATLSLLHAVTLKAKGMASEAAEAWETAEKVDASALEGLMGVEDPEPVLARIRERLEL
ncbi:MAG: hypothetical protein EP330_17410 [Deltaproteobacteria bacterium]|nr:MAG: hypothetical protein EP330_17410 [Deltaproteobacteria bacterium]